MLEHYFCLVEFKPEFEFICLNPFSKISNLSLLPLTFSFVSAHLAACFQPSYSLQPSAVSPRPSSPFSAAQPTFGPSAARGSPNRLPPPVSRRQVGPGGHLPPQVAPGSNPTAPPLSPRRSRTRAPLLPWARAPGPSSAYKSRRLACSVVPFPQTLATPRHRLSACGSSRPFARRSVVQIVPS
jgi:hypothetical protein